MKQKATRQEKTAQAKGIRAAIQAASDYFGIPKAQILSQSRQYPTMRARHVAIWVARQITGASYPDLAKAFNRVHHQSAIDSCRVAGRMENMKAHIEVRSNAMKALR